MRQSRSDAAMRDYHNVSDAAVRHCVTGKIERASLETETTMSQPKRCEECGQPPKKSLSRGLCERCYMRAWRNRTITTRPRHSDPLTLPSVRLKSEPKVNGAYCIILKSAHDRGHLGKDSYTSVLDAELGTINIHRLSFYRANGWLPQGHHDVIRHLCDRPGCYEPLHLRAGRQRVNVLKDSDLTITSINARKTHCKYGHEFTPENTYFWRGTRVCRECGRRRNKEWQERLRASF